MKRKIDVLVTGASRGIGNAICKVVSHRTSRLFVVSQFKDSLSNGINEIQKEYCGPILSYNVDQSKGEEAALELSSAIKMDTDKLDAVILCAGNYFEGDLLSIPSENYKNTMDTNLNFNFYFIRNIVELLKKGKNPRIIIIGSTAAYSSYSVPTYGIAKYALRGLSVNLRSELMKDNIGVTFVSPGGTLTDMWKGVNVPQNRLLEPKDLAIMIDSIFDLSPQAVVEEMIIRPMLGDYDE